jgi:histidine phosphotransferase ChpT
VVDTEVASWNGRLHLAELLAVRLCHDLSGPLGTLMGALELLAEDPETAAEAVPLAGDMSAMLGKRLRLLRAAWGKSAPELDVVGLHALLEGLPAIHRLRFDFSGLDPAVSFTPAGSRVVLNVLLLAAECLPGGGVAGLAGNARGEVIATISGPRAGWPPGFAALIADPEQAWDVLARTEGLDASRLMQGPLTTLVAQAAGCRLAMLMAGGTETAPPLLLSLEATA